MLCEQLNPNRRLLTLNSTEHYTRALEFGIPTDLLANIFNEIPDLQRFPLRQVCKYWHTVFFKAEIIQKLFAERIFPIQVHYFFLFHPVFLKMNPTCQGENLTLRFDYQGRRFLSEFFAIIQQYPKLAGLHFHNYIDCATLYNVLKWANQVRELSVQGIHHAGFNLCNPLNSQERYCQAISASFTNLRTLRLKNNPDSESLVRNLLTAAPNLDTVSLEETKCNPRFVQQLERFSMRGPSFTVVKLPEVLPQTTCLKELELSRVSVREGDFLSTPCLTGLTSLSLNEVNVSTFELTNLFSLTSFLTRLTLCTIRSLDRSALDITLTALDRLAKLKLRSIHCSPATERGLQQALEKLTNLRILSLTSRPRDAGFSDLSGSCLDLQSSKALLNLRKLSVEDFANFKFQGLLNTFTRSGKPLLLQKLKLKSIWNLKNADLSLFFNHCSFLNALIINDNSNLTANAFNTTTLLQGLKCFEIGMAAPTFLPFLFAQATQLSTLIFINSSKEALPPLATLTCLKRLHFGNLSQEPSGQEIDRVLASAPRLERLSLPPLDCVATYLATERKWRLLRLLDEASKRAFLDFVTKNPHRHAQTPELLTHLTKR